MIKPKKHEKRDFWIIYSDEWIETDESISRPSHAVPKGGERDEKGHVLNAFSRDHQFLHRNNEYN